MCNMNSLKILKYQQNPLKTPPPEIMKQGVKAILGYLKELADGSEPCYRMKLMIVGQENVGKTTLLRNLKGVKAKEDTISTDGIDIADWIMEVMID